MTDPRDQPTPVDYAANTRNTLRNIIHAHGGITEPTTADIVAVLIAAKVDMDAGAKVGESRV